MSYPNFGIIDTAKEMVDTDLQIDRATNGAARGRMFYTSPKRTFDFEHMLTTAERATLDAFYSSNMTASFTFTWPLDGVSYTCIFGAAPVASPVTPGMVRMTVKLVQV